MVVVLSGPKGWLLRTFNEGSSLVINWLNKRDTPAHLVDSISILCLNVVLNAFSAIAIFSGLQVQYFFLC